jgi:hypothetical protein
MQCASSTAKSVSRRAACRRCSTCWKLRRTSDACMQQHTARQFQRGGLCLAQRIAVLRRSPADAARGHSLRVVRSRTSGIRQADTCGALIRAQFTKPMGSPRAACLMQYGRLHTDTQWGLVGYGVADQRLDRGAVPGCTRPPGTSGSHLFVSRSSGVTYSSGIGPSFRCPCPPCCCPCWESSCPCSRRKTLCRSASGSADDSCAASTPRARRLLTWSCISAVRVQHIQHSSSTTTTTTTSSSSAGSRVAGWCSINWCRSHASHYSSQGAFGPYTGAAQRHSHLCRRAVQGWLLAACTQVGCFKCNGFLVGAPPPPPPSPPPPTVCPRRRPPPPRQPVLPQPHTPINGDTTSATPCPTSAGTV